MNPKATRRAAASLVLFIFLACRIEPAIDTAAEATASVEEREQRQWRLVFLFLDDNDLAGTVAVAIHQIAAAPEEHDASHRIFLRDSRYDGTAVEISRQGELAEIPLADLPAGSLLSGGILPHILTVLHREFPADRQVLIVSGHGRGWRGIGSAAGYPRAVLTGAALGEALESVSVEAGQILVLEAGWSGFAENLYSLKDSPIDVIAAAADVGRSGMDHAGWIGVADRSGWQQDAVRDALVHALRDAQLTPEEPLALNQADLGALPHAIDRVLTERAGQPKEPDEQQALQQELVARAHTPVLPGEAHLTLGDLSPLVPEQFRNVLLHLVLIDEHGVPTGHAQDYRRENASREHPFLTSQEWAPDLLNRRGFLFDLWYRSW